MKKIQPTYSAYTREDMDALFGTRPATSTAQSISCPDGYAAYTIEAGDTLRSIAETRGITLTELLFYNPSLNPYGYKKGDVICVPADINDTAPAQPDTGDLSTPPLPDDNAADDEPAQPGVGPDGLPMPTLPSTPVIRSS